MQTGLEHYLQKEASITEEIIKAICSLAEMRSLRKNEFLLVPGDICRHKVYVEKGLLRNFGTDAAGNEHILQFAPEQSWTLDVESYDKQQPATMNIAAIEPSEVLLWLKADFDALLNEYPQLRQLSQQIVSRNIYLSRQRMLTALSATPEEKYEQFISQNPALLQRLPLWMIASHLGISLKTLTRIRHAQLHR